MAQKTKGPGIQSAAGLIRYFDAEEDTNIKVPPMAVVIFGLLSGNGPPPTHLRYCINGVAMNFMPE